MEWNELMQKCQTLSSFFEWEQQCLPRRIMMRLRKENQETLRIPVSFETKTGQKISAALEITIRAWIPIPPIRILVFVKRRRKPGEANQYPVFLWRDENGQIKLAFDSYEAFAEELKFALDATQRDSNPFDHHLIVGAFVRAHHDFRRAIEDFFARACKLCTEEEYERWRLARLEAHAQERLKKIVQICEASRATVGKSKTLKDIRETAEQNVVPEQAYGLRLGPELPAE